MLHTIESCSLISIPERPSVTGRSCGFVNGLQAGPFDVKRFFFIYDVPHNARRGAHAHKTCHQLLIPVCGSFQVIVKNNINVGPAKLIMNSSTGANIFHQDIEIGNGLNSYMISREMKAGVYYLQLIDKNSNKQMIKVIIK